MTKQFETFGFILYKHRKEVKHMSVWTDRHFRPCFVILRSIFGTRAVIIYQHILSITFMMLLLVSRLLSVKVHRLS